ncbi:MAG: 7-cyano-7-deazaguanine synthase [Planctomycetes bacterium]|nr:7-cyano-7-deazaguanine synthase [Planctomycetota bacterium]MCH8192769.1 7-cyano-7-deazaguanine synthase [Planctomycetota bacterium]
MNKAIVLTHGGIHSTTALAVAASRDYELYALSFDYGQKNRIKLEAAKKIAAKYQVKEHRIVTFDISMLLESPGGEAYREGGILSVPARNNLFLSFALSWAEVIKAGNLFIGVNSTEYGDRPDCRSEFIHAFENLADVAMKKGDTLDHVHIWSPCMKNTTALSILTGMELGVDYSDTYSCPDINDEGVSCGECLSCENRKNGFKEAGITDPTRYSEVSVNQRGC